MEQIARRLLDDLLAAVESDPRIVGLLLAGSTATGEMDEFSDVDTVIVSTDESHPELLAGAHDFAAAWVRCWRRSPATTWASRGC